MGSLKMIIKEYRSMMQKHRSMIKNADVLKESLPANVLLCVPPSKSIIDLFDSHMLVACFELCWI